VFRVRFWEANYTLHRTALRSDPLRA